MATSCFHITPQMIQLFHECVEKKNYLEFYNYYKCDLEALSEKLKTVVDLPKNSMIKYYAHNFMDCFELLLNSNRRSVDNSITPFQQSVEYAIEYKDWNIFYWGNRNLADFVIREARHQRIIDIYIVDGVEEYLTFYDRDCDVSKKKTKVHLSKNNGVKLVRPFSYENNCEVEKVYETSAESRKNYSMTHHEKPVSFTCSTVKHQGAYEYSPSSRHMPTNHCSACPYQENSSTWCPSQTDRYRNQQNSSSRGKNSTPLKYSSCLSESSHDVQNQVNIYQQSQSNSQQKNSDPHHLIRNSHSQSGNSYNNATRSIPSGSECQCYTCLKPFNDRADHQFVQPPLAQSIKPQGNSGSTIRDSHTGYKQKSSSNHSFDAAVDGRDELKTQSLNPYNRSRGESTENLTSNFQQPGCLSSLVPKNSGINQGKSDHSERSTANIERPKPSEKLNREKYDGQLNNIDEEKNRVLAEAYKNFKSNCFDSLQNPRTSESSGELIAGGCNDTSVRVENIEQSEDEKSVKRVVNETDQYSVPPRQDSRMPPSSLTSNVQLDNPKNSKEAQTDSDSLNSSLTIVSLPYEDLDTLKQFELNNTSRQSSEEIDISDVPVPEIEQPQPLMLGDLWSGLDKPESSQRPALRSDSFVDRNLEDLKRYAEDVKQHTTNAFIDTEPSEPKITEKEYSEDEEENTTINRDFHRKFQEQTERNQEELRRKREERAARRREHEEELSKMRQVSKQRYLIFFNCLGLKLRFEEQEHNWKGWIQGCKQCVSKLLEVFNQFVSEVRRNYRGLKNLSREDEADFQTEISFLLSDIMNTYNSLGDSFEQLTHLESMFEDVMFIKVLKKCIAESATRLLTAYEAAGELSEHASQDNFQNLQNTFNGLTPSLIYSTTELRRICKENSYSDNYENVKFPHIPNKNSYNVVSSDV